MDATETTAASANGLLIVEEYDQVDNLKVVRETGSGSPAPSEQSYVDFDPVDNEYVVYDLDSCSNEQNCAYVSNTGTNDQPPDYLEVITVQQNSAYNIEATNVMADSAENDELYEVLPEEGELYEYVPVLPEREHTGIVPERRELYNVVHESEDAKKNVTHQANKPLCSFWQGRVEVAIRIIILIVSPVYYYVQYKGRPTCSGCNKEVASYIYNTVQCYIFIATYI